MTKAHGEVDAGEAAGAAARINARRQGSRLSYYLLMLGMGAGGGLAGYLLGLLLERTSGWRDYQATLAGVAGLWIGVIAYALVCRPWAMKRFRQRMTERGLATRFTYALEISSEGLSQESGRVKSLADWSAVTEVFRAKGYWIFLVQTNAWVLPTRFFPDHAAEKAFLSEALGYMSPEARVRSPEAEAFATG